MAKEIFIGEKGVTRVIPLEGELLPPVRKVPDTVDPYAGSMPVVQMVSKYESTPITRAQALTMKTHQVTVALAILTAAGMVVIRHEFLFMTWLVIASVEWVATFALLAVLDWRETPAAANWRQTNAYLNMMQKEQDHRLRAMYPDQYVKRDK